MEDADKKNTHRQKLRRGKQTSNGLDIYLPEKPDVT